MAHVSKNIIEHYSRFDEFRKLEKYTDVTIVCEQTSFQCHRVALALASPYFDSMFSLLLRGGNINSAALPPIALPDAMKFMTFGQVLQFIYTGDVIINSDNVFDLIVASDTLILGNLEDLCIQYLKEGPAFKNIYDVLSFAYTKNKHILVNVLVDHVIKYLKPFLGCQEFLEFPFRFLSRVLTNPKFTLSSIGIRRLENAIIRWINHSREERSQYLNQFLELLNSGKYENSALITFKSNDLDARVGELIDYESLILRNRKPLNVFINHRAQLELSCNENWVQVFKMDKDFRCFSTSEVSQDLNEEHAMKCVAIDNSYLYCLNYYDGTSQLESRCQTKFSVSTSIDGQTEKILTSPPGPSHLFEMCEIIDSILYHDKDRGSNYIYSYNKGRDKWFSLPPLDKNRQMACVTACNNTHLIYLIGGYKYNGGETNSVQAYDIRTSKWQNLPSAKFGRQAAACCLYKDKVYVSGGAIKNCFEVYDPVAGKWEELKPTIRKVSYHCMVPYEKALWVMGGIDRNQKPAVNHFVDTYDPVLNEWDTSSVLKQKYKAGRYFEVLDAVVFKPYW